MTYGVITICLNSAATIGETIASVFAQEPRPAQYVFVDGGSTDATLALLAQAQATGAGLTPPVAVSILHQQTRGGIPEAWNIGLAALTTDVVCLLNSDDWYEPGAMAAMLALFAAHPEAEIVAAGQYLRRDAQDAAPRLMRPKSLALLPVLMPIVHPACFVRRSVYARVGEFDVSRRISADYDFIWRCRRAGIRFYCDERPLVNMRTGGLALSSRAKARAETYAIARRHSRFPLLPALAYFARRFTGR